MIVFIPAFEPSMRLPGLVAELREVDLRLADLGGADPVGADPGALDEGCGPHERLRVVVVDDGSGAAFAEVFARTAAAGAEVLRHSENLGKGVALKTGFRHVMRRYPGEGVVTADADGQHSVADILAVCGEAARLAASGDTSTMVLGCREFDGSVPIRSRFGNDCSRALFRIASGWSLSDTQTGLRAVPHRMLAWLLDVPGERFEYEQRVLLRLQGTGFRGSEVPIRTIYLDDNASSHFRPVVDSLRVMLPVLAFAASSFAGFVIDALALFICNALTGALIPSIIAARVLSAGANFWMNRRLVFLQRGRAGLLRQLTSYVLLALVLLASNIVWLSFLTEQLGWSLWIAKPVTEFVLFCTSYRVQRTAVFGGTAPAAPRPAASSSPPEPAVASALAAQASRTTDLASSTLSRSQQ